MAHTTKHSRSRLVDRSRVGWLEKYALPAICLIVFAVSLRSFLQDDSEITLALAIWISFAFGVVVAAAIWIGMGCLRLLWRLVGAFRTDFRA